MSKTNNKAPKKQDGRDETTIMAISLSLILIGIIGFVIANITQIMAIVWFLMGIIITIAIISFVIGFLIVRNFFKAD